MQAKHALAAFLFGGSILTFSQVSFGADYNNMPPDMRAQIQADEARHAKWMGLMDEQRIMDERHFQEERAMEDRHYTERKTLRDKQAQERNAMSDKIHADDGMPGKAPQKK